MANNGEWQTVQYFVEGVKVIKCFHPQMLTPLKLSKFKLEGTFVSYTFLIFTKIPFREKLILLSINYRRSFVKLKILYFL